MKHNKFPKNQKTAIASKSNEVAPPAKDETAFVPSADEVARRAYFTYVNEGSQPGHEVQHWLEAEAQLLKERNLRRVHGFHNRT
jgi:hypothetical protein